MVDHYFPLSLKEALEMKGQMPDLIPFAGGTDFMVVRERYKGRKLLFLGHLEELKTIQQVGNQYEVGACATYTELVESPLIPEFLKGALRQIAAPAIRNAGTMGGNICNASPAGDSLPVLYSLDAWVKLASTKRTRTLQLSEFIQGVRKTAIEPDEILLSIGWDMEGVNYTYYEKIGARRAQAISKVSIGALAKVKDSKVQAIKISLGAVGPRVVRSQEVEGLAKDLPLEELEGVKSQILNRYEELLNPIDDQRSTAAYRKKVCLNLIEDFLESTIKANS